MCDFIVVLFLCLTVNLALGELLFFSIQLKWWHKERLYPGRNEGIGLGKEAPACAQGFKQQLKVLACLTSAIALVFAGFPGRGER